MNQKISITGVKARTAFIKGADYVADAVKSSIGPFGLNASIEKGNVIKNNNPIYKMNNNDDKS
jgi:chaperonin GroEL (HSP60 family)